MSNLKDKKHDFLFGYQKNQEGPNWNLHYLIESRVFPGQSLTFSYLADRILNLKCSVLSNVQPDVHAEVYCNPSEKSGSRRKLLKKACMKKKNQIVTKA